MIANDFKPEDWQVHVLKGKGELLDDIEYISFTGDFGFRHSYGLLSKEVIAEYIEHEKKLLSHFDANIINLEFILPGIGEAGKVKDKKKEFQSFIELQTNNLSNS